MFVPDPISWNQQEQKKRGGKKFFCPTFHKIENYFIFWKDTKKLSQLAKKWNTPKIFTKLSEIKVWDPGSGKTHPEYGSATLFFRGNTSTWWQCMTCDWWDRRIRRMWEPTPTYAALTRHSHSTAWHARPRQVPVLPSVFDRGTFWACRLFFVFYAAVFWIRIRIGFNQVSGSGSGPRRAKLTHKQMGKEKSRNFMFWKCWMFNFEGWRLLL